MENLTEGEIIKVDTRGRMQTKRERRAKLLEEFGRSGMSGQQFAQWAGIKYTTFASWRQKQRRELAAVAKEPGTEQPVQWVEAVVGEGSSGAAKSTGLLIDLGRGFRLSVEGEAQARLAGLVLREVLQGTKPC